MLLFLFLSLPIVYGAQYCVDNGNTFCVLGYIGNETDFAIFNISTTVTGYHLLFEIIMML